MVVDMKLVKPHIGISTDTTIGNAPHYFDELPSEDEERLGNIFKSLDVDGNGKIDIHDLSVALQEFGLHHKYAQSFIERADANQSKDVSLAEFIQYVREHEKNLRLGFSHIDKNQDDGFSSGELGLIQRNGAIHLHSPTVELLVWDKADGHRFFP